ncbi:RagB/SusD family nutrient uptake outer membrane protein [Aureibaculum marinum]|nr:RagB/SusD family nutrient uptake outer membrane protein [Aureibaculum marinum]
MKKLIKNFILILAVGLLSVACSDDLNRVPFDSIEQSQSFKSINDAENWDNGFYAYFRGRVSGNIQFLPDVQSDQLNASKDFGNRNGFPHRWEGFLAADYDISDIWSKLYSGITNANIAIAGFETLELEDPTEIATLEIYKADAHFVRAYYYFELVKRFSKDYDPATASSDLGVPLVLEYDVNALPARSTVQQVYDQILADIQVASTGLAGVSGSQGSNYFNADVVKALEARVKLTMEDWSGAKTAADELINSETYPLITSETVLADMWTNDYAQEVIYQPFLSAPNELTNTNSIYLGYNPDTDDFTPDFIPSKWVVDMYEDNDIRKNVYFDVKDVRIQGSVTPNIYLVNKFPGNPALWTSATTNYQNAPKVFRIAEMYLISAEAALMSTGDAATPLNALREARGLSAIGSPTMQDLKDERFRELAFEGFRLDDLKRWGDGVTRHDPQDLSLINTGSDYDSLSKDPSDPKFVWGIPARDQTVNPNLVQNPGW